MPELPDITVQAERLAAHAATQVPRKLQLLNSFVLRMAVPPIGSTESRRVPGAERLGKRVVLGPEGELFLAIHLMAAGSLRCMPVASTCWPLTPLPSPSACAAKATP